MPQFDRNAQKENKQRGSEPNFNWRGVVLIVIAFSLIAMAMLFYRGGMQPVEDVPYNRFLELLDNKQIVSDKNYPLQLVVEDGRPTQTLRGAYIRQGAGAAPSQPMPFRTTVYLNFTNDLQKKLSDAGMSCSVLCLFLYRRQKARLDGAASGERPKPNRRIMWFSLILVMLTSLSSFLWLPYTGIAVSRTQLIMSEVLAGKV